MDDDVKVYKKELKVWYKNVKASKRCEMCSSNKKKQFHHVNPDEKTKTVAQMVHLGYPKEEILEEMNKCIVLCDKCHVEAHKKIKKGV